MMPCVAYARVSSDEQAKAGYSIPYQKQRIAEYAKRNGFVIDEWFVEAHSARVEGRPEFRAMMTYLANKPDTRVVLIHKQDRISRNLTDWAFLTEALKLRVIPVEEPIADTPMGRMTQTFGAAMAKFYSDNLSAEVKKGIRAKFEAGGYPTRAPFGYRNVSRTRTQKAHVEVHPENGPAAVHMFVRYATGHVSLRDLSEELYDLGHRTSLGKPFPIDYVSRLLRHPFYKGLTIYQGELRPGLHEPLISVELWDQVQETLNRRRVDSGEKGKKFFLLRGFLFCGRCGRRFTADRHDRGNYYRCVPDVRRIPCGAPLVPTRQLEEEVLARVLSLELPSDHIAELLSAIEAMLGADQAGREARIKTARLKREKLNAKLSRIVDGYASGDISVEDYRRVRSTFEEDLHRVMSELQHLASDPDQAFHALKKIVTSAGAIRTTYQLCTTDDDRKDLLRHFIKRIVVTDRVLSGIEYNPPYDLLFGDTLRHAGSGTDQVNALLANSENGGGTLPRLP